MPQHSCQSEKNKPLLPEAISSRRLRWHSIKRNCDGYVKQFQKRKKGTPLSRGIVYRSLPGASVIHRVNLGEMVNVQVEEIVAVQTCRDHAKSAVYEKPRNSSCIACESTDCTGVKTGVTLVNSWSKLLVSVGLLIVGSMGGGPRL